MTKRLYLFKIIKVTPEQEFTKMYRRYAPAIFRYSHFKTSNVEVAQDLMQQTFYQTWAYLQAGQTVGHWPAFLYQTANHLIIDWYRRRKTASLDQLHDEQGFEPASAQAGPCPKAEINRVWSTLHKLSDGDQLLIIWHLVEQWPTRRIAQWLDEPANNVSAKIHRALERLRRYYQ